MCPAAPIVAARKRVTRRKLTLVQVQEARTRHYVDGETFASLGRAFDVGASTIRAAVLGETWGEVPVTYRRSREEAAK